MRNPIFFTLLLLIGAGCVSYPAPQTPSESVQTVEYSFSCGSYKALSAENAAEVDALLKQNGWRSLADSSGRVCTQGASERPLLVITDDCTSDQCSKAALLLVDRAAKTLKAVATEETSEFSGSTAIVNVLRWSKDAVTYRSSGITLEGPCEESLVKGHSAGQEISVDLATGERTVVRSCAYLSCDQDVTCTETK